MYRSSGRIVARPDRMYGNIARFALAHDRMFASTAHCSRRTAHWSTSSGYLERDSDDSSPRTADLSPDTADLSPDTADLSPLTADLSLDPDHVDHSTARSTTAPAQSKHPHGDMKAPPHPSFIPLGHRADAHGGRSHSARHTTRSKGHMRFLQNAVLAALKRVQRFLDDNVAVLAAIVDLTAARKRRSARSGEHICESIDVPRSCSSNCGALMNGFGAEQSQVERSRLNYPMQPPPRQSPTQAARGDARSRADPRS